MSEYSDDKEIEKSLLSLRTKYQEATTAYEKNPTEKNLISRNEAIDAFANARNATRVSSGAPQPSEAVIQRGMN